MERKLKILVVEDDPIIAEDLQGFIEEFGYEALRSVNNADDALKAIRTYLPDLCLLDVHLGREINGIQLAKMINAKWSIPIVFLTAFNDRDTIDQIKEIGPAAYLVKPLDERNLQTSIEVALSNFHQASKLPGAETPEVKPSDSIFIKIKEKLTKFKFEDIVYFEAYDNYSFLHTANKKYILSLSLKQLEERLSDTQFLRTHRSFIVNLNKIDGIFTNYITIGKQEIPIGKTYREILLMRVETL